MDSSQHSAAGHVDLAGPDTPRDNGLAGLGLIMQLGGTLYLGLMAFMSMFALIVGRGSDDSWVVLLIGVAGVTRSAFHRAAGTALIEGRDRNELNTGGPLGMTMTYAIVALVHTALVLLLFKAKLHMDGGSLLLSGSMLASWPLTLLIVINLPRFKRFADSIPVAEDRGFEGMSILMLLLGIMGAIFSMTIVVLLLDAPGKVMKSFEGMMILLITILLVVRSVMHARAGAQGVSRLDPYRVIAGATRYVSWGIGTSLIAICGVMLILMMNHPNPATLLMVFLLGYLLFTWPLIVRGFFDRRNTGLLGYEDEGDVERAPDLGMTTLGWLLLAMSVVSLAALVPAVLIGVGSGTVGMRGIPGMEMLTQGDLAGMFGRSQWISVGVGAVQLWAAIELVTMSPRWRLATLVYGVGATVVTIYVVMPMLDSMGAFAKEAMRGGFFKVFIFGQVAMQLVAPIGAAVLANRSRPGRVATARYHE